jgi:hypothetical protein
VTLSVRKRKVERKGVGGENRNENDHALHEATHGQFGKEPRPKPTPPVDDERENAKSRHQSERLRAARKRSRTL